MDYNKQSVDRAISSSCQPITTKQTKLIHSLLKGHSK